MNTKEKTAWIDEENKIVSFQAIVTSQRITQSDSLFGDHIYGLMKAGYRIMQYRML